MSDIIVITNAEKLIIKQYSNSLEKMYEKQAKLLANINSALYNPYTDDIGRQQMRRNFTLSMDTTFALQLSVYDTLEANLQRIRRDFGVNEFIGLDDLHKLYETRLLLTGHTL